MASETALVAVGTAVFLAVFVLYTPLLTASAWRATAGKRVLGLVVVDLDGHRLTRARSWGRFGLSLALGQFVVPNLTVLTTAKRQATHDIAAGTVVVHRRFLTRRS